MKYGKLKNGNVEYAGKTIRLDDGTLVIHPRENSLLLAGFRPVVDEPPPKDAAPAGCHWEPCGWDDGASRIVRQYCAVKDYEPELSDYDKAMEDHLRLERESRGYTTREPDAYLTSSHARWAQDARDWVSHRDDVMEYALGLINAVSAGSREPPTIKEFKRGLPRISWSYSEDSGSDSGESEVS